MNNQYQLLEKYVNLIEKNISIFKKKKKIKKIKKEVKLGSVIFSENRGDWRCAVNSCRNWNYSKRKRCNLCGSRRYSKSKLNNSPIEPNSCKRTQPDWKCVKCCFINFCSKDQCYRCSKDKPSDC